MFVCLLLFMHNCIIRCKDTTKIAYMQIIMLFFMQKNVFLGPNSYFCLSSLVQISNRPHSWQAAVSFVSRVQSSFGFFALMRSLISIRATINAAIMINARRAFIIHQS